jgi:dienelactone hydrolase
MQDWRTRHTPAQTRPALDALIRYLEQEKGIKKIYPIGYCFGARSVMDLILEGSESIGKAAFAHPSQLRVPDDFERLVDLQAKRDKNSNGKSIPPVLFLTCENDPQFPSEAQSIADEILEKFNVKDKEVLYKRVYYAGNDHGFAIRGDISKEHVKKAKEDAFKQALEWFVR